MFPVEKYNFSLILTGLATFSGKKQSFQAPKYARYICLSFLHNLLPSYRLSKGSADHEHYSNTLTLYTSHYTVRVGVFGHFSRFFCNYHQNLQRKLSILALAVRIAFLLSHFSVLIQNKSKRAYFLSPFYTLP